jgi:cytochrome c oxidase assembly protein Cox11
MQTVEEKIARHKAEQSAGVRELVVQFNADVADGMPWKFTPSQREVSFLCVSQSCLEIETFIGH